MKTVDEVAEAMFNMVKEVQGMKKLKQPDLVTAMKESFGSEVDKKTLQRSNQTID